MRAVIEAADMWVLVIPLDWTECNPIQWALSKFKAVLRKATDGMSEGP